MTESVISLGRETPYKLHHFNSSRKLLAIYADAVVLYTLVEDGRLAVNSVAEVPSLTAEILELGKEKWRVLLAGAGRITVLDQDLQVIHTVANPDEEDTQSLLILNSDSFLTTSEVSAVTCWASPAAEAPTPAHRWPVECRPLWATSKTVICTERGRLQERDPLNGTVLKTWPKSPSIQWATGDTENQHLLCVDETGQAWLWDLGARECLFSMSCEFSVGQGVFSRSGLGGALLGADGEVATFRVVEGGVTTPVATPETAIVSLTYDQDGGLEGLDENGGIWSLNEGDPTPLGGEWAGWATSTHHLSDQTFLIGTANGAVQMFCGSKHTDSTQLHQDAVVGLEIHAGQILSIGADATIYQTVLNQDNFGEKKLLFQSPGRFVVDYVYCQQSQRLCLALDEGLLTWFLLANPEEAFELQLEERRIEELNPAGPKSVLALTDRGSVKLVSLEA